KYTADDINRIFDEIGARYNASTSEEVTLYYAAILPEYLPQAFELLTALIYPSLRQDDFDMEKNVILEEIGMYEDQPSFKAYELVMQQHFAGHPLGQSILGSPESISALTSTQMRDYHAEHYKAGNIVLAVAGNIHWDEILKLAEQHCSSWPAGVSPRDTREAEPNPGTKMISKSESLQQHIMQLGKGPSAADDLRYAADILAVVVGDDGGSRLYWELVDPGHAEVAELGYNEYAGSGTWLTYLSCRPEQIQENLSRIANIYDDLNQNGITTDELEQAKNKVLSRIVLRSERPMGRLSSLGNNWVYRQEYHSVEHDLDLVKNMTCDKIRELLAKYPLTQQSTIGIGPLAELPTS
ncbi:MAG: insulinase family protein, partial [Planctomycetaceae bacterium]|nr:insulinase family protein [Planctomycetaceae bacterium]